MFRQAGAPEADERARAEIARAHALDPDLPEIAFLVYPLFERDTLLNKIRKAPEFVEFMPELKATVDGYPGEFQAR